MPSHFLMRLSSCDLDEKKGMGSERAGHVMGGFNPQHSERAHMGDGDGLRAISLQPVPKPEIVKVPWEA